MNQKIKYIGLLAILPLALVALSSGLIGEAEAATQYSKGTPNQSFGSASSPVCGGALCSESSANTEVEQTKASEDTKSKGIAYVEQYGISALGENFYKVTFTVYAGNEDLLNGTLHVNSDISHNVAPVKMVANSYGFVSVLIQADDPSTISAELAN